MGQYKDKDIQVIERLVGGSSSVRLCMVSPGQNWASCMLEQPAVATVGVAAFNPDFACFEFFHHGGDRVSRLVLALRVYEVGFAAG